MIPRGVSSGKHRLFATNQQRRSFVVDGPGWQLREKALTQQKPSFRWRDTCSYILYGMIADPQFMKNEAVALELGTIGLNIGLCPDEISGLDGSRPHQC
jgi:hypothetical protein